MHQCLSSFQQAMWLHRPNIGPLEQGAAAVHLAPLLAPFGKRLQAHLALIQNDSVTVSADRIGKTQQHCATHFKVGGTMWNMSFTCTNKHYKNTSGIGLRACQSVYIVRCFHPLSRNPISMTGRVLLLYCYFPHLISVSFHYSQVLTVSANLQDYFSFSLFCMMPSIDSTGIQNCIQNKVQLCSMNAQLLLFAITKAEMIRRITYQYFQNF